MTGSTLPLLLLVLTLAATCIILAACLRRQVGRRRLVEQRVEIIRDQLPDPLFVVDGAGRIKRLNRAARDLFAVDGEDPVGKPLRDIALPPDQRASRSLFLQPLGREDRRFNVIVRKADGGDLLVTTTVRPLDADGSESLVILRDISYQREMQRQLDASLSVFQTIADHAPVIIWETDASGQRVFLNTHWETFTGISRDRGRTACWQLYVHPDDRTTTSAVFARAMARHEPLDVEYRLLSRAGWRWVLDTAAPRWDESGSFVGYVGVILDIDDRRRSVTLLQESENRFRDVAMTASDMLWEVDAERRFTYLSDRCEAIIGVPVEEALGHTPASLGLEVFAGDDDMSVEDPWRADSPRPFRNVTLRWQGCDGGAVRWITAGGTPIFDESGQFAGYRGSAADVTAQVEAAAQLRHQAMHDSLTNLPNRIALLEQLRRMLATVSSRTRIGVLCLDLDRFKDINDTFGHTAGDDLLDLVAKRLKTLVDDRGLVARIGGDEFTIALHDLPDLNALEEMCQQVIDLSFEPFFLDGLRVHVGLSVGAALANWNDDDAERLLKRADFALYAAKRDGRETWRTYTTDLEAGQSNRKKLEVELREALDETQLLVHYQPQVELATGRMIGVEALARWPRAEGDVISPLDFIPLAEETRLIVRLGEFVLRRACHDIAPFEELSLSVNLSPVQLLRTDLVQMVESVLIQTGMRPDRLELEITESALLKDDHSVRAIMHDLKGLGVRLALDDFGTGFSSLSYLQRLPFDIIKLDRSFIHSLDRDPGAVSIVHAVIGLGISLGLKVIAEGVETRAQARFLTEEGCRLAQGFLYAPGLPIEMLTRLRGVDLSRHRIAAA